ncbi:hypothetical protein E8E12_010293 [Didymella heteroderae]|uniref:Uncharacterized protein n=1 Tax=Didymella heteroderae TaxID=1769908 RepID=A0A9P4X0J0_9PLEO|nr:hypothetical protein E8E12_010293 [Didymella heteroderae]
MTPEGSWNNEPIGTRPCNVKPSDSNDKDNSSNQESPEARKRRILKAGGAANPFHVGNSEESSSEVNSASAPAPAPSRLTVTASLPPSPVVQAQIGSPHMVETASPALSLTRADEHAGSPSPDFDPLNDIMQDVAPTQLPGNNSDLEPVVNDDHGGQVEYQRRSHQSLVPGRC